MSKKREEVIKRVARDNGMTFEYAESVIEDAIDMMADRPDDAYGILVIELDLAPDDLDALMAS